MTVGAPRVPGRRGRATFQAWGAVATARLERYAVGRILESTAWGFGRDQGCSQAAALTSYGNFSLFPLLLLAMALLLWLYAASTVVLLGAELTYATAGGGGHRGAQGGTGGHRGAQGGRRGSGGRMIRHLSRARLWCDGGSGTLCGMVSRPALDVGRPRPPSSAGVRPSRGRSVLAATGHRHEPL